MSGVKSPITLPAGEAGRMQIPNKHPSSMSKGQKGRRHGKRLCGRWSLVFGYCFAVVSWSLVVPLIVFAKDVKEPNVAGTFYPADADELSSSIRWYLDQAGRVDPGGDPVVLIVPHAGYVYSGPVAAYAFQAVAGASYETVVILATSHYFSFHGVAVYKTGEFRTPLGGLAVDTAAAEGLLESAKGFVSEAPQYFEREHSLEVEIPFLQTVLEPGFKILPVLTGQMSYDDCLRLASLLTAISSDRRMLVVASTDLSHYKGYQEARGLDEHTIAFLKAFDTRGLWDAVAHTGWNVCGVRPLVAAMEYARAAGVSELSVLKYANSGDTAGDKDRVVGYVSAVAARTQGARSADSALSASGPGLRERGEDMLTGQDKKRLLEIARQAIAAHAAGDAMPESKESSSGLNVKRGCFVTLRENGNLRGCIGTFVSEEPLCKTVRNMAIESATHDYRFSPLRPGELKDVTIEISVLSEPQLIDDWRQIRLGTDGVIVRKGFSSGVFLPQVATETGWDLETFLSQLCWQKAGLPADSYKDPQTKFYTFQADVFSEEDNGH